MGSIFPSPPKKREQMSIINSWSKKYICLPLFVMIIIWDPWAISHYDSKMTWCGTEKWFGVSKIHILIKIHSKRWIPITLIHNFELSAFAVHICIMTNNDCRAWVSPAIRLADHLIQMRFDNEPACLAAERPWWKFFYQPQPRPSAHWSGTCYLTTMRAIATSSKGMRAYTQLP